MKNFIEAEKLIPKIIKFTDLFLKKAEDGFIEYQYLMSWILYLGIGVEKDWK